MGPAYSQCDAYCSRAQANLHSAFGAFAELSADGLTLLVAVPLKRHADNTPPGQTFLTPPPQAGAVWVFSAPEGGWSAAPDPTLYWTEIAAQANARDVVTHYSPGPNRRVETADAELLPVAWSVQRAANDGFGEPAHLSADGNTVAVIRRTGANPSIAYIFEKPTDGWASSSTATATITLGVSGNTAEGRLGADLNADGSRLLVMDELLDRAGEGATDNVGGTLVFERSGDSWSSEGAAGDGVVVRADAARIIYMPNPQAGAKGGRPVYDNAGAFAAFGETDYDNAATVTPRVYAPITDFCSDRTLNDVSTTTCTLPLGNTAVSVPAGTPDGSFIISGRVNTRFGDGTQPSGGVRGSLEVAIGKVKEVDSAALSIATDIGDPTRTGDEKPYPSLLRTQGESTRLRLSILNENGTASHAGSVAAVLVSSSAGNLGLVDATFVGESCSGISCQLDNTKINADNADRLLITLSHAGKPATAEVFATVFSTTGESFDTSTVSIALAGPADSIAIAAPTSGVLNVDTSAEDDDGVASDDEDNRDRLLLAVTAADAAGNDVALPAGARRSNLIGPDGASVAAGGGVRVIFPHRPDPDERVSDAEGDNAPILNAADAQQVRIDIDRPATNPLPSGEYTLELWVGEKKAEQTFTVSGGPVAGGISLSDPGEVSVGDNFTVTATFNDASGVPVPNGTVVDWPEILSTGGTGAIVVQTSKDTRTTDGRASASWRAVNPGSVVVTAGAGCEERATSAGGSVTVCSVSGVQLVSIQPAAATPTSPVDSLTSREPGGLSSWLGEGRTSAAELLAALDGVDSILIWLHGGWVRYGVADGQEIPGSRHFHINPGAILWLGGGD